MRSASVLWVLLLGWAVTGTPGAARADVLPAVEAQDFYLLVPLREPTAIEADQAAARQETGAADLDLIQAQTALTQEKLHVEVKEAEISAIKEKIDAAKKEKNEAEKAEWEKQKKREEVELKLLERRSEMRKAEFEYATALKEAALMVVAACDLERKLLERANVLMPSDLDPLRPQEEIDRDLARAATRDPQVHDLERATLQARKDAAEKRQEAMKKAAGLQESRIKVLEAQGAAFVVRG
jgi:hypothetical protein